MSTSSLCGMPVLVDKRGTVENRGVCAHCRKVSYGVKTGTGTLMTHINNAHAGAPPHPALLPLPSSSSSSSSPLPGLPSRSGGSGKAASPAGQAWKPPMKHAGVVLRKEAMDWLKEQDARVTEEVWQGAEMATRDTV
jgi:hypothetical protein